jgi:hypothetical protein
MKEQLDGLLKQAMTLITKYASDDDALAITRIAGTANRIKQMQHQIAEVESEIPRIRETLAQYVSHGTHTLAGTDGSAHADSSGAESSSRKKLRIQIDWGRIGKSRGMEVVSEHKSSDTMTKWGVRLYEEMGIEALQKLSRFRISRGPMVSTHPATDFRNKKDGTIYSHQPIKDSGYFMLTHSQNSQKATDIRRASQKALALPAGMVLVEEVEKNGW